MQVFVPFDAREPHSRLAPVLDPAERRAFADAMRSDVVEALRGADHDVELLATTDVDAAVPVTVDERPLSRAVNAALETATVPVGVVMADLPLVTSATVQRLVETDGDVVLAPGLGGGTNALVTRTPDFAVDYHGGSYQTHVEAAARLEARCGTVDSFRLAVDVDDPGDLAEVLLHSEGAAAEWLKSRGFELTTRNGRRVAVRSEVSE